MVFVHVMVRPRAARADDPIAFFRGVDPSSLLALHALLEERHVTRAAARLGITQSSMSHRLRALREVMGDPLFVRSGATLVATPRAESMAAPLAAALASLASAVAPPAAFDPRRTTATITVALPDLLSLALPPWMASLGQDAPGVTLRAVAISAQLDAQLASAEASMALAPIRFAAPSIRSRVLGELRFAVCARKGHPALRGALTLERWLAHRHVVIRVGNDRSNVISDALASRGLARTIGLEAPSFVTGLLAAAESDLLMNAPMPLARSLCAKLGLVVRELPLPIEPQRFALLWHERLDRDPAQRWLRGRVFELCRAQFAA